MMQKKAEVKAPEVKTAKTEEVKATVESKPEVKAAVKKEAEPKKAVVSEEPKKAAAKATPKKKTVAKKATKKTEEKSHPEVFVQFDGMEAKTADIVAKAKALYVAEGHRESSIKSLQVYIKPDEHAAYYVINKKHMGRVDLF